MGLVLFSSLALGGCAVGPTHGLLWTDIEYPSQWNAQNSVPSLREAEGCQIQVFTLFTLGKAGAGEIAFQSGIRRIATIDQRFTGFLYPVYGRYCTIVTGD
jgi:hypothetical protein